MIRFMTHPSRYAGSGFGTGFSHAPVCNRHPVCKGLKGKSAVELVKIMRVAEVNVKKIHKKHVLAVFYEP